MKLDTLVEQHESLANIWATADRHRASLHRDTAAAMRMLRDVAEAGEYADKEGHNTHCESQYGQECNCALKGLRTALAAPPVPVESKPKGHAIPTAGEHVVGCDSDGTPRTINHKPIDPAPDPRLIAPNGRAMVKFYNTERGMRDWLPWGIDDQGKPWCWTIKGEWSGSVYTNEEELIEGGVVPCRFDGTPLEETKPVPKPDPTIFSIPEMRLSPDKMYTIEQDGDTFKIAEVPKPDPLARAVTVADLLKLADLLHAGGAKFVADCVREVAKAAGGSKPA